MRGAKPAITADLYQTLCEVCAPQSPTEVDAIYTVTLALAERLDYDTGDALCRLLTRSNRARRDFERHERWPLLFPAPEPG